MRRTGMREEFLMNFSPPRDSSPDGHALDGNLHTILATKTPKQTFDTND